jgi:rhodanese-related sulfurtransferase
MTSTSSSAIPEMYPGGTDPSALQANRKQVVTAGWCNVAVVPRSLDAREVWNRLQRGEAEVLDLRTAAERRRFGAPPGAKRVSLVKHVLRPARARTIYLCQHAVRSKATLWRGAAEVAGGFVAWQGAGLPVDAVKE